MPKRPLDDLTLTPEQRIRLCEALLDAYPRPSDLGWLFKRLELTVRLRVGARPQWQQSIFADLVHLAESEHWVGHLAATAAAGCPHNQRMQAITTAILGEGSHLNIP
jgi:hypothetical protein